jgi:three-Cys-motif partner protein
VGCVELTYCQPGREVGENLEQDEYGMLRRVVPPHSISKLHYARRLADITSRGMKDYWPQRVYIELFSGPGSCRVDGRTVGSQGSALLSMTIRSPFTQYHFVDINPEVIRSLEARSAKAVSSCTPYYYPQDCNAAIDSILPRLPERFLGLAFIDPTGWQVHMETIRKLATASDQMDLLFTFHSGQMRRVMHLERQPRLDAYFGDGGAWREIYRSAPSYARTRQLADHYNGQLRGLGYLIAGEMPLVKNSQGSPQYLLIYASRHRRGVDFWQKAVAVGPAGERALGLGI